MPRPRELADGRPRAAADDRFQPRQLEQESAEADRRRPATSRARWRAARSAFSASWSKAISRPAARTCVPGKPLVYGQSITDGCIGWEDSRALLDTLAEAVRERRLSALAASRVTNRLRAAHVRTITDESAMAETLNPHSDRQLLEALENLGDGTAFAGADLCAGRAFAVLRRVRPRRCRSAVRLHADLPRQARPDPHPGGQHRRLHAARHRRHDRYLQDISRGRAAAHDLGVVPAGRWAKCR